MKISDLLLTKYKFLKSYNQSETDLWDCGIQIHELHWLFYSENLKHFTLAVLNESRKGKSGGGIDKWKTIIIPRLIYSEQDVITVLRAFNCPLPDYPVEISRDGWIPVSERLPGKKYVYVCPNCESSNVETDAQCQWDIEKQNWELMSSDPDNGYCFSCGSTTELKQMELPEPPKEETNTLLSTVIPEGTKCTAENCNEIAIGDYSGHGDYACAYHMKKWNREFEEDYD
jgi:hypothetical protein